MCLESLCREVAEHYRLRPEEARKLLERTLSESLTEALGKRVIVYFSGGSLSIYRETGGEGEKGLEAFSPHLLRKELVRRCRYLVEAELQKRKAIFEHGYLKALRGSVVRGVIDRIRDDGAFSVLFYVDELFNCREVAAICPLSQQPPGERELYAVGAPLFFFVSDVRLIGREMHFKVDVRLSRTSMRLPELLLKMQSGIGEIRCVRRVAGRISVVVARERLPREAITAVAAELGERIKVSWDSSANLEQPRTTTERQPTWE